MGVRTIIIIPVAHAAKLSIVSGQMGYVQDFTQGRRLCSSAVTATPSTPATHYLVNDQQMNTTLEQNFRLMAAGEYMPQVIWADVPDITETSANAAAAALQVVSEAGGDLGDMDLFLEAKSLQFVPDPVV